MATRRQEKIARVVKESVYDAVRNHLSDPRLTGFVTITRVEMAPNLRNAEVYVSVFGGNATEQKKTFLAIQHARTKIQSIVAGNLGCKFCPILHFHVDDKFKKTLDTLNLIDKAVGDIEKNEDEVESDEVE